jgi:hypothetical protein
MLDNTALIKLAKKVTVTISRPPTTAPGAGGVT